MDVVDVLRKEWCYPEKTSLGYNVRLRPLNNGEIGELLGWISDITLREYPRLAEQYMTELYDKHRLVILERIQQMNEQELLERIE